MHFTLRQLQVFQAVARLLSFTRAAEVLHLSQPAVSMQMRQLEEVVELPLFEKIGKKIYLTEAGKEMFYYSQTIGNQLQELKDVMESLKGVKSGYLRISVATTANHFATRLIAAFIKRYDGIKIALDITNRKTLLQQLVQNETDLVIMGEPPQDIELEAVAFMENPLVVIISINHPLARQHKPISILRLAEETFVVREVASGTRDAMERFFQELKVPFNAGIEITSNEAIKHSVEAGLGLGIVSIHTLELELEAKKLAVLNVKEFPIIRHWHMVHLKGKRLTPIAEAFKEFLLGQEAANLLKSTVSHPVAKAAKGIV